jgi:hypothetical protein
MLISGLSLAQSHTSLKMSSAFASGLSNVKNISIVDGVNGVAYGATSLWEHTIGLCAIHTCVWNPSAEPPEIWSRNKDEKTK